VPKKRRLRPATFLIIVLLSAVLITLVWVGMPYSGRGDDDAKRFGARFSVPNEEQRLGAIGPTDELTPLLQNAFNPQHDFQPLPKPGPTDWLTDHVEFGQTFEQFVAQQPKRPDEERSRIYILPLGEFDPDGTQTFAELQACAEAFFQLEVKILPAAELAELQITNRINRQSGRRQYLTVDLLELLRQKIPPDAYCLVGLTMEDLYAGDKWNFVFGFASLRDHVGVFSLARNDPSFYGRQRNPGDAPLITRRGCRMLCHETGHIFGMLHCTYFSCLMNGSNHLEEADAQPMHLCPICLRKLSWKRGDAEFVARRYEQLEHAFKQLGLEDDARWIANRRARFGEEDSATIEGR